MIINVNEFNLLVKSQNSDWNEKNKIRLFKKKIPEIKE